MLRAGPENMIWKSPDLDRRAFARRRAKGTANCRSKAQQGSQGSQAKLVDISQAGVGLLLPEPLHAGDLVALDLIPPVGPHGPTCHAEVRWTGRLSDGSYRIGCRLEHRLRIGDIQKFV